jgi:hypothetical protein
MLCQITSAQAAYWLSPGWRPSDEIQPGVPRPEMLAAVMSIHPKPRLVASSFATSLKASVRSRMCSGSPYSRAAVRGLFLTDLVVDPPQRGPVLSGCAFADQVVDADQDRDEVWLEAPDLRELVIDQVLGGETVHGRVRELNLLAGLLPQALHDDPEPAVGGAGCARADRVRITKC